MRLLIALFVLFLAAPSWAQDQAVTLASPIIGQPAPEFTGRDTTGNDRKLSTYQGKVVVLEWTSGECPYVKKHYDSGNMQKTQELAAQQGAIWLRLISSGPGMPGHVSAVDADRFVAEKHAVATATILDESGEIGHLYGAMTTPHMFVIDKNGILVYAGAIDDKPTTAQEDLATAKNYVKTVLNDLAAGRPVSVAETKPYGCAIKYAQ
jgi:peroxiredoxin